MMQCPYTSPRVRGVRPFATLLVLGVFGAAAASGGDTSGSMPTPQAPFTGAGRGRLVPVGTTRVDVGSFPSHETRTARFELRNPGPGAVDIVAVSKSCGCAEADVSRKHVEPDETVEILLRTIPRTLSGPFGKSFYVVTTATGDARVVQLSVAGRSLPSGPEPAVAPVAPTNAVHAPLAAVQPVPSAASPLPSPARDLAASPAVTSIVSSASVPLSVEFFVQEGCAECKLLRAEYLPRLRDRYGGRVAIRVSDTHDAAVFLRLLDVLDRHGIVANEPLYLVVGGLDVLSGWDAVRRDGFAVLDRRLAAGAEAVPADPPPEPGEGQGARPPAAPRRNAAERLFARFTPALVAAAGLADGLNPCAFATIVFLTTLLAAGGRKGGAVFLGGLAFCLASFATYLAIGLGLLRFLRSLEALGGLRKAVEWGTVAALALLGALSLLDALRFARTGDARAVALQLPDAVKRRIRGFARDRWGGSAVFGTGLACGAGVTVLESVCTGQMYLPTLVFMSRAGGGARAWGLLLLYNAAFIVPLFAVFVFGALGVRSQRLAGWTRRNVVPSKLLLAAVFLVLASVLALRAAA